MKDEEYTRVEARRQYLAVTEAMDAGVNPFKLRVDWFTHYHYGDAVVIELHVIDEEPRVIHRCATPPEGAGWARKWLVDRGFGFWCDVDLHQRRNDTYITLHPQPLQPHPPDGICPDESQTQR